MPTSLRQDLIRNRKLKRESTEANRLAKDKTAAFKQHQARVLERMEREDVSGLKTAGTLFTPVENTYAQIDDRAEFVRWALENSEALANFIGDVDKIIYGSTSNDDVEGQIRDALIQAIDETDFIKLVEHKDPLNALVRERLDDGQPLPPGVTFRTESYISQRSA